MVHGNGSHGHRGSSPIGPGGATGAAAVMAKARAAADAMGALCLLPGRLTRKNSPSGNRDQEGQDQGRDFGRTSCCHRPAAMTTEVTTMMTAAPWSIGSATDLLRRANGLAEGPRHCLSYDPLLRGLYRRCDCRFGRRRGRRPPGRRGQTLHRPSPTGLVAAASAASSVGPWRVRRHRRLLRRTGCRPFDAALRARHPRSARHDGHGSWSWNRMRRQQRSRGRTRGSRRRPTPGGSRGRRSARGAEEVLGGLLEEVDLAHHLHSPLGM